jgi:ATP-binding cassette subfamily B protein
VDDAPSRRLTFGVLRGAARAWRELPPLATVALGSLVAQQLFFSGFAFSLKAIVDDVTKHRPVSELAFVLALLFAGFLLAALATVVGERASARAAARIVNGIRRDLYGHLLRLSPAYFLTTPPGKVLNRFTNDLKSLEGGYVQGFLDTVVLVISTVITVPLLFWLDWRLALITCLTLPVVIVVVVWLLPRFVHANDTLSASELDIVNTVQDTIRAQQVVRTFQLEPVLTQRFDDLLGNQQQRSVQARVVAATVGKGTSLGVLFVQLVVIVVGAELAAHRVITLGSLVAFITVLAVVAKNIYDFASRDLPLLAEAGRGSKKLDELLGAPVVVTDPEHGTELPLVEGEITFDRVSFAYTPGKPALADVSFDLRSNASVALVGANGSGKTTVLSLLMRFYDPDDGVVRVDGRDLREVTQKSFRSQMSVVLQSNFLFNDTIRENIRIGNPDASDTEVVEAAGRAELHDFVMSLPERYDTSVGESGGRLSGGQRQRLAIARALIRDPRILLLDEVTTALDPSMETSVNATLARVGQGRTVVSVTHRLAAARNADQILVFDHGRLVERGTHDDLFAGSGLYRTLWDKQSGFEVSRDGRQASVDPTRLRHITLFTDLDDDTLAQIALGLTSEYYEADQTVFAQGEFGDRFYLIARGQVEVIAPGADGEDHVLDILGDGDHFGELALLQDRPRTATIRTVAPSVLLTMGRDELLKLVASTPEMSRMLEQRMIRSELNLDEWRRLVSRQGP